MKKKKERMERKEETKKYNVEGSKQTNRIQNKTKKTTNERIIKKETKKKKEENNNKK